MVLGWKTMGWELLPHAEEFKHIRVLEDGAGDKLIITTVVGGICGNCRCYMGSLW